MQTTLLRCGGSGQEPALGAARACGGGGKAGQRARLHPELSAGLPHTGGAMQIIIFCLNRRHKRLSGQEGFQMRTDVTCMFVRTANNALIHFIITNIWLEHGADQHLRKYGAGAAPGWRAWCQTVRGAGVTQSHHPPITMRCMLSCMSVSQDNGMQQAD